MGRPGGVLKVPEVDAAAVRPSTDDVAMLLRTRTVDAGSGEDVGAFTAGTRPSDADVSEVVDMATDTVLAQLPEAFDPELYPATSRVIALRAAVVIESSFFRVQAESGRGSTLMTLLTADEAALNTIARQGPRLF